MDKALRRPDPHPNDDHHRERGRSENRIELHREHADVQRYNVVLALSLRSIGENLIAEFRRDSSRKFLRQETLLRKSDHISHTGREIIDVVQQELQVVSRSACCSIMRKGGMIWPVMCDPPK